MSRPPSDVSSSLPDPDRVTVTDPYVGRSSWRARAGMGIGVIVVTVGFVVAVVGPSKTWGWIESQWRLDVGAPASTSAYPASADVPLVHLAVAGDVGTGGSAEQKTADVMDSLERADEYDALLLLGDNVYPSGDPSELQAKVLDPFAQVLDGSTELVPALGNHDVQTDDGEGQVAELGLPGRWYAKRYGPVRVIVVDSTRASDVDQLSWLEEQLSESSDAAWTVVIQHHPPFSAGYHGSHTESRDHLVPLYEKYDVDLVLAGHDHDYQHIAPQNGVNYVVSGGAAKLRKTAEADFTISAASTFHFVELSVFADRLDLRAVDHDGRVFDAFSLTN